MQPNARFDMPGTPPGQFIFFVELDTVTAAGGGIRG
jgi:hypothetical protein